MMKPLNDNVLVERIERDSVSKGGIIIPDTAKEKPVSSTAAAFSIVPRINASGRFGSASDAVDMLLSDDPEEAAALARKLDNKNK